MQLSAYRLLLYPAQESCIDIQPVLEQYGMLGKQLTAGVFSVGEQFLDRICFLGCSPDIGLEPLANKAFCYIQLPAEGKSTTFRPIRKPELRLHQWIIIGNIHESEAIPDTALLHALEATSGHRWKFAFLKP